MIEYLAHTIQPVGRDQKLVVLLNSWWWWVIEVGKLNSLVSQYDMWKTRQKCGNQANKFAGRTLANFWSCAAHGVLRQSRLPLLSVTTRAWNYARALTRTHERMHKPLTLLSVLKHMVWECSSSSPPFWLIDHFTHEICTASIEGCGTGELWRIFQEIFTPMRKFAHLWFDKRA